MTLSTTYGLTSTGFVTKTQQQILIEVRSALQSAFGVNVNLRDQSPFGQILNIFSEREAYLWQLAEAIYSSQYPTGAEGTSVDNILALNGMSRIPSRSTKTADTNSDGLPGLVLYGTPGTVIPAGSIISVTGIPTQQFSLDASVTIGASQDCEQFLSFAGGPPTAGTWKLNIVPPGGTVALTTSALAWNCLASAIQAAIRLLTPDGGTTYPYTDVTVAGTWAAGGFTVYFGTYAAPTTGQADSSALQQNLFTISDAASLVNVTTQVNGYVSYAQSGGVDLKGHPAQGIGSATCTVAGPTAVGAGQLAVIGSPIAGWETVTNPQDCVVGALLESDSSAIARRASQLSSRSGGTLTSIVDRVLSITDVVSAVGFENTSMASWQNLAFEGEATNGHYHLTFNPDVGSPSTTAAIAWDARDTVHRLEFSATPTGGAFTITMDGITTAAITYTATALDVQTALRAAFDATIYGPISVTGNFTDKVFYIGHGNFLQKPITTGGAGLTNGGAVTITVTPSIQAEVNGTSGYEGASINGTLADGVQVIFGGDSGVIGQGLIEVDFSALTGVSDVTETNTLDPKSFEIIVDYTPSAENNAAIAQAIYDTKPAGIKAFGGTSVNIPDSAGNNHAIGFTHATSVTMYVTVSLVTDLLTASAPVFSPGSIPAIQAAIAEIGNAVGIGGLVVGYGSGGLMGAFNAIPGILSYTLTFARTASPTTSTNVQMASDEVPVFELHDILVSYV